MNLVYTSRFKKDFKRMMGRNKDENKLWDIVDMFIKGRPLPTKCKDHPLGGN